MVCARQVRRFFYVMSAEVTPALPAAQWKRYFTQQEAILFFLFLLFVFPFFNLFALQIVRPVLTSTEKTSTIPVLSSLLAKLVLISVEDKLVINTTNPYNADALGLTFQINTFH